MEARPIFPSISYPSKVHPAQSLPGGGRFLFYLPGIQNAQYFESCQAPPIIAVPSGYVKIAIEAMAIEIEIVELSH